MLQRVLREPVVSAWVARILAIAAARYGLELSLEQVVVFAGVLEGVLVAVVRQLVSPVKGK